MRNLEQMARVLYGHRWETLADWVDGVRRLADLSDPEIHELTRLGCLGSEGQGDLGGGGRRS